MTGSADRSASADRCDPDDAGAGDERPVENGQDAATSPDAPGPRRGHRRAVRRGNEREQIAGPSQDETGPGWGERDTDSNDDRLRRDVPPHYGR